MLALFLKYFVCSIFCFYSYIKILNIKRCSSKNTMILLISSFFICLSEILLSKEQVSYRILLLIITSYFILTTLFKTNYHTSMITLLLSYGICFSLYTLSAFIIGFISLLLFKEFSLVPHSSTYIFTGLLQSLLMYKILHNKRIHNGLLILIQRNKTTYGIGISIIITLCIIKTTSIRNTLSINSQAISLIYTISFSIFLLYYWRHRIKQTYIENLRRLENLTYENMIADKDKQIKELEANNAYLAQIIHKYRKVIPAMELSVMELLQNNANWDTNTLKSNAQALQVQLEELRAERNNLLDNYQKDMVVTPQSGLHTIDALIALMEKQAKEQWVRYKTQIDPSIKELALASVKEADLLHLLGDLIENALHAVNESDHKEILIHISKLNGCLLLEVSDSGAAFDIETYQHFGNEPFTSHEADGGSGTGLMEIWKLKKEYKISLYIYEYETDSNVYTKKISFLFDKKNHFLLKTYRDKEVKNALIRGDLHVFPHKND